MYDSNEINAASIARRYSEMYDASSGDLAILKIHEARHCGHFLDQKALCDFHQGISANAAKFPATRAHDQGVEKSLLTH